MLFQDKNTETSFRFTLMCKGDKQIFHDGISEKLKLYEVEAEESEEVY